MFSYGIVKNVYIINDLGLFYPSLSLKILLKIEKIFHSQICQSNNGVQYTIIGHSKVLCWGNFLKKDSSDILFIVGKRPALEILKIHNLSSKIINFPISRIRNEAGYSVDYTFSIDLNKLAKNVETENAETTRIGIFEDIIFTGGTLRYVLEKITDLDLNPLMIKTYALTSSIESLKKIKKSYKNYCLHFESLYEIKGRPIIDFTVFFISDLLFGKVNGIRYIDKKEWMTRCFPNLLSSLKCSIKKTKKLIRQRS